MPDDSRAVLPAILAAWGLPPDAPVTRVPEGSVNRVYRVDAPDGPRFLRAYRTADPEVVAREHRLLGAVRRAGLPGVAPLPTAGGASFVACGGGLFALYPAAPGRQVPRADLTAGHADAAGALLGRLHRALAPLPDDGYRRYTLSWTGPAWVRRLEAIEAAVRARPDPDETDAWALRRAAAQRAWLASPECPHRFDSAFPAQVTHGDFHDANLFFAGGTVTAVIDWEQAALMPRAFEVVRACAYMFRGRRAETRALLAAYRREVDLGDAELADGARAWGVMGDHHVWALEEAYLHGNERAKAFVPHEPFRPFALAWAETAG